MDYLCFYGRLYRNDDRLGLRGLGNGLVLPALLLVWRLLPDLLPVLADLRIRLLVQPVHGSLWHRRTDIWTLRWSWIRRQIQPEYRHVCARRICLWAKRSSGCRPSLQPANG